MRLWPVVLVAAGACVIPPLSLAGKTCSDSCPEGYSCQSEVCVPDGEGLCDVLDAGSCLDFDHGVGTWTTEVVNQGAYRIVADGGTIGAGLESGTPDLGGGTPGRLDFALPAWSHATLTFDFFPELGSAAGGDVAIAEIQCASSFRGAWFHYVHGQNAFVLIQGGSTMDPPPMTPLSPPPAMGVWNHIVLEATPGHGQVWVEGKKAAEISFDPCPDGQWQVTLGLVTIDSTTVHSARFDNVVVNTTP